MPRQKPSVATSIVPESIRDMIGNRVSKEDRAALDAMSEEARPKMRSESTEMAKAKADYKKEYDDMYSFNPVRMYNSDLAGAYQNLRKTEEETGGYSKGGMVKKYAKGGMVKVRGYGKARSKPCKIC